MNIKPCEGNHCERCCGGNCSECFGIMSFSDEEMEVLREFAVCPFLPVAADENGRPIYLENNLYSQETYANALSILQMKRVISIDYDIPLQNYDYHLYRDYDEHGSMALTLFGQYVIDHIDRQ